MPKIEGWETIEAAPEQTGGERLEPTGYKCKIVQVLPKESKKGDVYYQFLFDIAEGEEAGRFSEAFYRGKDWLHAFNVFVHTPDCIAMSKRTLQYITESNPGFDADAAFLADNFKLFEGKKIGVTFGLEEYQDQKTGETKTSVRPRAQKRYGEITGKEKPKVKLLNGDTVKLEDYEAGKTQPKAPQDSPVVEYHTVTASTQEILDANNTPF